MLEFEIGLLKKLYYYYISILYNINYFEVKNLYVMIARWYEVFVK